MARKAKATANKTVATLTHEEAKRKNIPTAEYEAVVEDHDKLPIRVAIERRNRDLDPQLVWSGKDEQDASNLIIQAPPLYIQEKVHPKALIDDLLRETGERAADAGEIMPNLFADFNGLPKGIDKTEFYKHDQNWSNRMILGDSLQVMASLAEREGLRGKVQCIYIDPPYGIKFNSNFQWSTTNRDVKDGVLGEITREPEQVRAFRDTWRDGVNSYLSYLRNRLLAARKLLANSGSIFVQIGDENVHRVRAVLDEVFGADNFMSLITVAKTTGAGSPAIGTNVLASVNDFLLWYARDLRSVKYRQIYSPRRLGEAGASQYDFLESPDASIFRRMTSAESTTGQYPTGWRIAAHGDATSQTGVESTQVAVEFDGRTVRPTKGGWKTNAIGMSRLAKARRLTFIGNTLRYRRRFDDFAAFPINNYWNEFRTSGFSDPKVYVVQTNRGILMRCLLMATDPGDLVLDPTCGSGTTAAVAEQLGRRWIVVDTSRVALALSRARVMGSRFPYYVLADSKAGQEREGVVSGAVPSQQSVRGDIRRGFVYERLPHITLKSIANNGEIDLLWTKWQGVIDSVLAALNALLGESWREWEVPQNASAGWTDAAWKLHAEFLATRLSRQEEIDKAIASRADAEYLYDRPYEDKTKVRVAGPFTVESLSPHRTAAIGIDDQLIDPLDSTIKNGEIDQSFPQMILENLKTAGVQQAQKDDKIGFTSLAPWPGSWICAEGRYLEGGESGEERRAGIFIGPEFGTVTRTDLVAAAREAADAGFDVLISCAFSYEAHTTEFNKLGKLTVLKARMNADLHMSEELKNTGKGNLFVVFGEPDIDLLQETGGTVRVRINGVDVFHPNTGEVRSDGREGIACWFIDTDYNEESFFVRHAYFLGANDPYGSLKTTLRAEIDEEGWESLHSDTSRAFPKPKSGRIAVKVINHLGDEVMKIFKVT